MTELRGDIEIAADAEKVHAALHDAAVLVGCVKDIERVEYARADAAAWDVRPNFGFPVGVVGMTLNITPGEGRTNYVVSAKGGGGNVDATGYTEAVRLESGTTRLAWVVSIDRIGGLLKMVPKSLLASNAQREIEAIVGRLGATLQEPEA